jgi:hypothetical protein
MCRQHAQRFIAELDSGLVTGFLKVQWSQSYKGRIHAMPKRCLGIHSYTNNTLMPFFAFFLHDTTPHKVPTVLPCCCQALLETGHSTHTCKAQLALQHCSSEHCHAHSPLPDKCEWKLGKSLCTQVACFCVPVQWLIKDVLQHTAADDDTTTSAGTTNTANGRHQHHTDLNPLQQRSKI